MTEISNLADGSDGRALQLENLPKTALQAIYHAVTGKTENMSKELYGSVLINSSDIDNLYDMINDQLGHYEKVCDPTVTVVVKHADERTVTYSSWARFKALKVHHLDVTSEIVIKIETVIRLPETSSEQRFIINVDLDSALPIMHDGGPDVLGYSWFMFMRREWRTVKVNVDFVDFLVAKVMTSVIEEWFKALKKMPCAKVSESSFNRFNTLRTVVGQSGRMGLAAFLATYAFLRGSTTISVKECLFATAVGLCLWSVSTIGRTSVIRFVQNQMGKNFVPTVILMTEGDTRAYGEVKSRQKSGLRSAVALILTALLSILLNVISSAIYARM
jgi:hypothetical protein